MTIDKAIEILQDYHDRLPRGVNDDYVDAIKLGIEALKRTLDVRRFPDASNWKPLPRED